MRCVQNFFRITVLDDDFHSMKYTLGITLLTYICKVFILYRVIGKAYMGREKVLELCFCDAIQ